MSKKEINSELSKQINLFNEATATHTSRFTLQLANYINKQAALGISDEQIIKNLQEQIDAESGIVKTLIDDVSKVFGQSVSMISNGVFNTLVSEQKRDKDLREWITVYAGNESVKHCTTCLDRHKDVKTLAEWQQIGTPDNPFYDVHLSYGTPCYCLLVPIDISSKTSDLLEPIDIG